MVTTATRDALVVVYAPSEIDRGRLTSVLDTTAARIASICGGAKTARVIL